jgi:methyl halide transferase
MTNNTFDEAYWTKRYDRGETGWDIGYPAPALCKYIDGLADKSIDILIPGCGNAYEAEYAWKNNFIHTKVMDISAEAIKSFLNRYPDFPEQNIIHGDFFQHNGQYDLIIEQTFFCALHPSMREAYVSKMNQLLKPGGRLVGVLFNCELNTEHPPFGGFREEYQQLFSGLFNIRTMDTCYNSIKPREGRELFIIMEKA